MDFIGNYSSPRPLVNCSYPTALTSVLLFLFSHTSPDSTEIVIFDPAQILPYYVIHVSRSVISRTPSVPLPLVLSHTRSITCSVCCTHTYIDTYVTCSMTTKSTEETNMEDMMKAFTTMTPSVIRMMKIHMMRIRIIN
jgi:hypothetical protein